MWSLWVYRATGGAAFAGSPRVAGCPECPIHPANTVRPPLGGTIDPITTTEDTNMDDTTRTIIRATGCTEDQAQAAIAALIDLGWSLPNTLSTQTAGQHVATVAASALADIPAGSVLTAHTDGACSGNPGAGGWSVVFSIDGTIVGEFSGAAATTTNNRMELTAVLEAIGRAPSGVALEILTDSKNVIGWLAQGWKRREPTVAKLAGEIDAAMAQRAASGGGKVTFSHVAGHSGDPLNERADQLATGAIRR